MVKVNEEQIARLVDALEGVDMESRPGLGRYVGAGESIGFYHGMISALVLSHKLVQTYGADSEEASRRLTHIISLAAAHASQLYLDIKRTEDAAFPELLDIE